MKNKNSAFPLFGLGTYKLLGQDCTNAVEFALENEISLIDTASFYENEESIGEAVKKSTVEREKYNLVSKIWTDEMRSGKIEEALMRSLSKLKTEYLDAYLIHWPVEGKWQKAYEQLLRFEEQGVIRSLGVCNFTVGQLEELNKEFNVYPILNQVEMHVQFQQEEMQAFCKEKGILCQAWRPLMNGAAGSVKLLKDLGVKYNKSPYQIILRYFTQKGIGVIPKSSKNERILENSTIFDFNIEDEDLLAISALNEEKRTGPDPLDFNF